MLSRVVVETALALTGLLVLYAVVPLRGFGSVSAVLGLLGSVLGAGLMVAWQARQLLRSPFPMLRVVRALTMSVSLFLVLFASSYASESLAGPGDFSQPLTRVDALYFAITVFTTVGFGDITPVSETARIVVSVQMLLDLVVIGVVIKLLLGVARKRLSEQEG
ncbi:two pore domain potassium channel family protein [Streptomyces kaniharaensis]|uniref:Two pore domain potassium channel family protein n=2 Tax=Streptomyces kaniharaensis TaxID=212423 RepID=A0A6N7L3G7_9ACTN|nr:two pore domain potassium channel family protein [Streptomyces kaniharaensis]